MSDVWQLTVLVQYLTLLQLEVIENTMKCSGRVKLR